MANNQVKNYSLIDGLFSNPHQKQVGQVEQVQKRTFKISNEYWDDFLILFAAQKTTQAELINTLIKKAVQENSEKIANYKKIISKC